MSVPQVFVGIDVAKAHLDIALRPTGERRAVTNDEPGITALVTRLQERAPQLIVLEEARAYMGLGEVLPEPLEARAWRGGWRSNFSQCVEGQSLCPWEQGSIEETRLFACADLENGEEMVSFSASGDELQSVRN